MIGSSSAASSGTSFQNRVPVPSNPGRSTSAAFNHPSSTPNFLFPVRGQRLVPAGVTVDSLQVQPALGPKNSPAQPGKISRIQLSSTGRTSMQRNDLCERVGIVRKEPQRLSSQPRARIHQQQ